MRSIIVFCLLVTSSAFAQDHCVETSALSAAAAKIYEAKKLDAGITLCHVATGADDCTHTIVLPPALAKKHLAEHATDWSGTCEGSDMIMVAVSGTLEEGFPLRPNLDYTSPTEKVPAVFLGRALIRGLRAHLDMKDPNSREYKAPPALNPVNPALIPSGNQLDANVSSIYLVDRRQAARALLNEPRFLSMVPDLAKVEIDAEETTPDLRKLLLQAIKETPGITNTANVTFLQVISVWHSCHFVPSPVLYTKPDGTRVTDFPNSLAKFAGTTDATRVANPTVYNAAVESAVRAGVEQTKDCTDPVTFPLGSSGHYSVDKSTKRMIDAYRPCAFEELATRAGLTIDIPQCPN
ncbi:MAG TPA: hypothetical protein VFX59_11010 [Polyangiales bacterium]|nr:hypothetical protein [Polyangiales bacterium]